jgi:hypothetical protein
MVAINIFICIMPVSTSRVPKYHCLKFVLDIAELYRLCGTVVRVSVYRSRGPGSIPGSTKFSEK